MKIDGLTLMRSADICLIRWVYGVFSLHVFFSISVRNRCYVIHGRWSVLTWSTNLNLSILKLMRWYWMQLLYFLWIFYIINAFIWLYYLLIQKGANECFSSGHNGTLLIYHRTKVDTEDSLSWSHLIQSWRPTIVLSLEPHHFPI